MTSLNHDRLIKRMIALLGATGLAAVSGLPVLAQSNTNTTNNGVLNPNPSIFNEAPYNQRSSSGQSQGTQSQGAVDCSAYLNGGVGGPIDNGSSANNSMTGQSSQSSYDTATLPQNRSSESMNQSNSMNQSSNANGMSTDGQFSATNPNATIPFRANAPAGTSGGEANLNLQANDTNSGSSVQSNTSNSMMGQSGNSMSSSMNQSNNSNGMRVDSQFSATNPNAAIPFRANAPAGTSGGEANLNLQAYSANKGSFMQSAAPSGNLTSSTYSAPNRATSNQSAAPIPVECLPGGVNNR